MEGLERDWAPPLTPAFSRHHRRCKNLQEAPVSKVHRWFSTACGGQGRHLVRALFLPLTTDPALPGLFSLEMGRLKGCDHCP